MISQQTDRLNRFKLDMRQTFWRMQVLVSLSFARVACLFVVMMFVMVGTATLGHAAKKTKAYSAMTLRIEMSPAQCSLDARRSKLRQCREGYSISVSGLRPEISANNKLTKLQGKLKHGQRCSRKRAVLPPLQAKVVSRIMPDQVVRDLAWQHYGACMGMSTQNYFRLIAKLSGQLRIPKELSSGNNYIVNRELFESQLRRNNSGLGDSHVQLLCKKSPDTNSQVLTELQVCYDSAGKFSRCQQPVNAACPSNFLIRGLP